MAENLLFYGDNLEVLRRHSHKQAPKAQRVAERARGLFDKEPPAE